MNSRVAALLEQGQSIWQDDIARSMLTSGSLQSMIDAAKTVKPALDSFYSSLSGEQKARFNRIGQQLSQND